MQRFAPFLLALTFSSITQAEAANWLTDYGAAKLRTAADNKPLLVLFTGSDWCPACQKLRADVLGRPEFGAFADTNLVLLEVDFPKRRPIPPAQQQANANLAQAFRSHAFPTMVLLDPRGQEVCRPTYAGNGVGPFVATLNNYVQNGALAGRRRPGLQPARQTSE